MSGSHWVDRIQGLQRHSGRWANGTRAEVRVIYVLLEEAAYDRCARRVHEKGEVNVGIRSQLARRERRDRCGESDIKVSSIKPSNEVAIGVGHASTGYQLGATTTWICFPKAVYGPEGRVDVEGAPEVGVIRGGWKRSIEVAGLVKRTGIGTGGWSGNAVVNRSKACREVAASHKARGDHVLPN